MRDGLLLTPRSSSENDLSLGIRQLWCRSVAVQRKKSEREGFGFEFSKIHNANASVRNVTGNATLIFDSL